MKYHAFYIDNNILIRITNKETTSFVKEKDISTLYNNEEIIGFNIFNVELNVKGGLLKIDKNINDLINERLASIKQGPLDIDENEYFVVGYVTSIEKHPNSEKLNICQVDLKNQQVQIVCGASNVAAQQKVVVAKVGAVLQNGTWIEKGNLMNVESNGMICSSTELGLTKTSQGILVLDDSYEVGAVFK